MRGGVNSTGIDQAAAMMLRALPCALVTSTVGPWLISRLACSRATGLKWGLMVGVLVNRLILPNAAERQRFKPEGCARVALLFGVVLQGFAAGLAR